MRVMVGRTGGKAYSFDGILKESQDTHVFKLHHGFDGTQPEPLQLIPIGLLCVQLADGLEECGFERWPHSLNLAFKILS
jgi:hypothetical protein